MSDVEQWEHDEQRAMENEIISLREQVEKLTEECVVLRASNRTKLDTIAYLEPQLAALAERNELLTRALNYCVSQIVEFEDVTGVAEALRLPDLASPVLNKYRAEGMEEAAKIANEQEGVALAVSAIRARSAELEKSNG